MGPARLHAAKGGALGVDSARPEIQEGADVLGVNLNTTIVTQAMVIIMIGHLTRPVPQHAVEARSSGG